MRIVRNRFIPFKGFKAVNLCGILFVRKDAYISEKTMNHESIHNAQIKELVYLLFYGLYLSEWLIRLIWCWNLKKAYRNISFEREAYTNESNWDYLKYRKHYVWIKDVFK